MHPTRDIAFEKPSFLAIYLLRISKYRWTTRMLVHYHNSRMHDVTKDKEHVRWGLEHKTF